VGRILRRGEIFRDYILYWVVWRFGFTKNRMYSLALGVGWMDGEKKKKGCCFCFCVVYRGTREIIWSLFFFIPLIRVCCLLFVFFLPAQHLFALLRFIDTLSFFLQPRSLILMHSLPR
jgi:hypothetical protein